MLDCSPRKIAEYSARYRQDFWQLRTPLTRYKLAGVPYGLDNGCFTAFNESTWKKLLDEAQDNKPLFVTLPDVVGSAIRTSELFDHFAHECNGLPRALVLQDGIGSVPIQWKFIKAVFVGGSDAFKISQECLNACRSAKLLGKHVHVGRVNTVERVRNWIGLADSIDGSGLSRFDYMLENVLAELSTDSEQYPLAL
jgi:hypothetical protein